MIPEEPPFFELAVPPCGVWHGRQIWFPGITNPFPHVFRSCLLPVSLPSVFVWAAAAPAIMATTMAMAASIGVLRFMMTLLCGTMV